MPLSKTNKEGTPAANLNGVLNHRHFVNLKDSNKLVQEYMTSNSLMFNIFGFKVNNRMYSLLDKTLTFGIDGQVLLVNQL